MFYDNNCSDSNKELLKSNNIGFFYYYALLRNNAVLLTYAMLLLLLIGCEDGFIKSIDDNDESNGFIFNDISEYNLSKDTEYAKGLNKFISKLYDNTEAGIYWEDVSELKMSIPGVEDSLLVIIAPVHNIGVNSNVNNNKINFNYHEVIYYPHLNDGFVANWSIDNNYNGEKDDTFEYSGYVMFSYLNEGQIFKVNNDVVVGSVNSHDSDNTMTLQSIIERSPNSEKDFFELLGGGTQSGQTCLSGPDCSFNDCYQTASESCSGDAECDILCSLLSVSCTVSIAAACWYLN